MTSSYSKTSVFITPHVDEKRLHSEQRFWKDAFSVTVFTAQVWEVGQTGSEEKVSVFKQKRILVYVVFGPVYMEVGTPDRWGNMWRATPTYGVIVIKLKWEKIWTGALPHLSRLPHLIGVPHLHVNRPLDWQNKNSVRESSFLHISSASLHDRLRRQNTSFHVLWRT